MSKRVVTVHIFAIEDAEGKAGMLELKVPVQPWNRKSKKRREAFGEGVAAGTAALMQHFQPKHPPKVE